MKVIIPAAGYATRLWPLTKNQPKALLMVKGKPIVEHIIKKIMAFDEVDELYLVSNEKFFTHFDSWNKSFSCNIPIAIFNDKTMSNDDRLGQIGDIQFAIETSGIDDDLLIIAGDNLFNFSLQPCYDFFREKRKIVNGLWDCRSKEEATHMGIVAVNSERKIISFVEKPKDPPSTLASIGLYFIPMENVALFREYIDEGNDADKMGYFMEWALDKETLYGYVYREKWFDIGRHEALRVARKEFEP